MKGHNLKVFAGRGMEGFADKICARLKIKRGKMETVVFSNGNLMPHIEQNVRGADVFVIANTAVSRFGIDVNALIMELLLTVSALKSASAWRVTAVVPYIPYARSDKKDQPRIPISARVMADLLQAVGTDRILTMDMHADQIGGFYSIPVDHLEARPLLAWHYRSNGSRENIVVVASDVGEAKEAGGFVRRLDNRIPLAIIDKRRIGNTDKTKPVHLVGTVEAKHAVVVDDEIATAGTIIEAAEFLLQKHGATSAEACATHAVFSGNAVQRLRESAFSRVVVTDTVPLEDAQRFDKLTVLSVAPLFADAIRRIHTNASVSLLFKK